MVFVSVVFGIYAKDVNSVLQWIVSALWGGYIVSNVLKWYWWRFNGHGYFWGMVAGLIPALILPLVFRQTLELYYFPLILVISLAGGLLGTFMHPPTEKDVLEKFYKTIRPWGFWKPVHDEIKKSRPAIRKNMNFGRDMFNVVIGTVAQTALVALPVYIVLRKTSPVLLIIAIILITGFVLKKNWYDKLEDYPQDEGGK